MLGIGIDFGTSNSSVALYDGEKLRYVELEPSSMTPKNGGLLWKSIFTDF